MIIELLYRISSHNQVIEVDDVSTSLDKVSKKVVFFEHELPKDKNIGSILRKMSIGTVVIVDSFSQTAFKTLDTISGAENKLTVHKFEKIDNHEAYICQPEGYLTFYIGQVLRQQEKIYKIKVVTLSDRAYRGIYEDKSGPKAVEMLKHFFKKLDKNLEIDAILIPDNKDDFINIISETRDNKWDILITTGGTGIGKRDITVDTLKNFIGKEIPGIMEMIRLKYGAENPKALLSRSIAGIMNETLVYALPGSIKAVEEYLSEIFLTLDHLFYMLNGVDNH